MLINNFYTCEDVTEAEGTIDCRLAFNADHAIFGGHFPGQPVVPGVCMIEIVKELLQQQVGQPLVLRHAGNAKFLQMITPEMTPAVTIAYKQSEDGYSVKASFSAEAAVLFKLDGTYRISQAQQQ